MPIPAIAIAARQLGKKALQRLAGKKGAIMPGGGEKEKEEEKCSIFEWMILFFFAVLADILTMLLNIGFITAPIASAVGIISGILLSGWSLIRFGTLPNKKRFFGFLGAKIFPFLGAVPFWVIYMWSLRSRIG